MKEEPRHPTLSNTDLRRQVTNIQQEIKSLKDERDLLKEHSNPPSEPMAVNSKPDQEESDDEISEEEKAEEEDEINDPEADMVIMLEEESLAAAQQETQQARLVLDFWSTAVASHLVHKIKSNSVRTC